MLVPLFARLAIFSSFLIFFVCLFVCFFFPLLKQGIESSNNHQELNALVQGAFEIGVRFETTEHGADFKLKF